LIVNEVANRHGACNRILTRPDPERTMTKQPTSTIIMMAAVTGLVAFATGCPSEPNHGVSGYCDDSGCFECDLDKHCWPIPNPKCSSDLDCQSGSLCTSIGCARACSVATDCAEGESCVTGFCAPGGFSKVTPFQPTTGCTADTDCQAEQLCSAGACIAKCKSDDDCGPDSVCTACGKCEPKGVPATCGAAPMFCSEQVGCGTGKSCVNNRCHAVCASSESCPVGQVCSSGLCLDDPAPAKPECKLDLDCGASSGICINGYCHALCKTGAECSQGALCQMGVCQPDYTPASN
jgi:hypothetical protein